MKKSVLALAAAGVVFSAHTASAKDELVVLTENDLFNVATVEMGGDGNRLQILQEHTGRMGANTIEATIVGAGNGGPLGSSFTGAALQSGLQPGSLVQVGFDNAMTISVEGSHNLFAFAQTGSGNRLSASVTGLGNRAAVAQYGINNRAGFSQNGTGNMISITQISW